RSPHIRPTVVYFLCVLLSFHLFAYFRHILRNLNDTAGLLVSFQEFERYISATLQRIMFFFLDFPGTTMQKKITSTATTPKKYLKNTQKPTLFYSSDHHQLISNESYSRALGIMNNFKYSYYAKSAVTVADTVANAEAELPGRQS
ncbi:hypothetical protein N7522_004422, partial [Penicillium canescens]